MIGVSEDAVSGHIQLLIPGETACFACAPPLVGPLICLAKLYFLELACLFNVKTNKGFRLC